MVTRTRVTFQLSTSSIESPSGPEAAREKHVQTPKEFSKRMEPSRWFSEVAGLVAKGSLKFVL